MFDIIVIILFILGIFKGIKKGAVKICYEFISFFLSLYIARVLYIYVKPLLEVFGVTKWVNEGIENFINFDVSENLTIYEKVTFLEELNLPDSLVDFLAKNNNIEIYTQLGVEKFEDYIISMLSMLSINLIAIFVVFVLASIVLSIIGVSLKIIQKIPVIGTIDKILGGGVQVLLFTLNLFILNLILLVTVTFDGLNPLRDFVEGSIFGNYQYLGGIALEFVLKFFS